MLGAFEDQLVVLSTNFRIILQIVLWPLVIVGVLGNVGVVCRICFAGSNTSFKPFYRCCMVSLALADLLLLGSSGANVLSMIADKTLLWRLSDLSCTAIPYLQTVAVLVASFNLAGVALDRHAAIRPHCVAGPGWRAAISIAGILWAVAAGASYPVLGLYNTQQIIIINNSTVYTGSLCLTDRQTAAAVYTALFAVIFTPLGTIFVVIYVLLARQISSRQSPNDIQRSGHALRFQMSQDNSTASTSVGTTRAPVQKKPTPMHIIRKRRTVRVILVLIVVFAICRIPQWTFLLVKLHMTTSDDVWWHLQVILTALTLLNASVHPFMYAFLNESLSLVLWAHELCVGKMKSPVDVENIESETRNVKVPRGPYCP